MDVQTTSLVEPNQLDLLPRTVLKAIEREAIMGSRSVRDPIGSPDQVEEDSDQVQETSGTPRTQEETLGELDRRM